MFQKISFPLFSFLVFAPVATAAVIDLQDKSLAPNAYYTGADNAGGFASGGAFFNNSYTDFGGGFYGWGGWSYSNVVNTTTPGLPNQYASYPGGGSDAAGAAVPGGVYAVGYSDPFTPSYINLPAGQTPQSVRLTNTTYAALSMKNGDQFAKKFGGPGGNDADYFKVTLTGYAGSAKNGGVTGSIDFYLADYRFADNAQDYIVNNWRSVDLTPLGAAQSIGLAFASSDVGQFGINTPTYLAMDNLTTGPEPGGIVFGLFMMAGLLRRDRTR
jgi:hypothetical protein